MMLDSTAYGLHRDSACTRVNRSTECDSWCEVVCVAAVCGRSVDGS